MTNKLPYPEAFLYQDLEVLARTVGDDPKTRQALDRIASGIQELILLRRLKNTLKHWTDALDERQSKEVQFARLYEDDFAHGTTGHNQLILIATLARALDNFAFMPVTRAAEFKDLVVQEINLATATAPRQVIDAFRGDRFFYDVVWDMVNELLDRSKIQRLDHGFEPSDEGALEISPRELKGLTPIVRVRRPYDPIDPQQEPNRWDLTVAIKWQDEAARHWYGAYTTLYLLDGTTTPVATLPEGDK